MSQTVSSPIRTGLVGYGYAGRTFHAPLMQAVEGVSLVAVASSDADKVAADLLEVVVHRDLDAMIAGADPELIVIATPNRTHAPLARIALEAGRHVVIDKPFALDLAEARGLMRLAERVGRNLWVFHNRRWDSDYLTVRRIIGDGRIGRVTHFESKIDRFRPQVRDRWRERAEPGGGIWFDLGPHLVDQALQLFGLPDDVLASIARQRDGAQADDWAHAILRYGNRRVVVQATMLAAGGSARFVVHGTDGSIVKLVADRQEAQLLAGLRPGAAGWGADPDAATLYGAEGAQTIAAVPGDQRRFYEGVVDRLRRDAAGPGTTIEALAVMAVIEAGHRSADTGAAVAPALTDTERTAFAGGRSPPLSGCGA